MNTKDTAVSRTTNRNQLTLYTDTTKPFRRNIQLDLVQIINHLTLWLNGDNMRQLSIFTRHQGTSTATTEWEKGLLK